MAQGALSCTLRRLGHLAVGRCVQHLGGGLAEDAGVAGGVGGQGLLEPVGEQRRHRGAPELADEVQTPAPRADGTLEFTDCPPDPA